MVKRGAKWEKLRERESNSEKEEDLLLQLDQFLQFGGFPKLIRQAVTARNILLSPLLFLDNINCIVFCLYALILEKHGKE